MAGTPISEDRLFLRRVRSALLRLAALGVFLGTHYVINMALARVAPRSLTGTLQLAEAVIFVVFLLIYAFLAWDVLAVFIPQLRLAKYATEESIAGGKPDQEARPEPNLVARPEISNDP